MAQRIINVDSGSVGTMVTVVVDAQSGNVFNGGGYDMMYMVIVMEEYCRYDGKSGGTGAMMKAYGKCIKNGNSGDGMSMDTEMGVWKSVSETYVAQ